MRCEWDAGKNLRNRKKHGGVSFELASLVFDDDHCLIGPDQIDASTGEQRWHALGSVAIEAGYAAVLFVVHSYRENRDGEEIIRIISARPAEKHEVRRYTKQTLE